MTSNTIPFPRQDRSNRAAWPSDDRVIAERTRRAVAELQSVMDAAVLAGLVVDPSFTRIEGRIAGHGVRMDSFVCKVDVYRGLA